MVIKVGRQFREALHLLCDLCVIEDKLPSCEWLSHISVRECLHSGHWDACISVHIFKTLLLKLANISQCVPQVYRPQRTTPPGLSFYVTLSPSWLPFCCFPLTPSIHLSLPRRFMSCRFPIHHFLRPAVFSPPNAWHFHWLTHMARLRAHAVINVCTCVDVLWDKHTHGRTDLCCITRGETGLKCQT